MEFGAFKAYVGAGVIITGSNLHNSFAPAAQIGFDYMIDRHWGANLDVKKLWLRPNWDGTATSAR